jgi:solute carrier family 25 folate transporter 32
MTDHQKDTAVIPFVSGLVSGFTSTVLFHPLDIIKTRLQVDESTTSRKRFAAQTRNLSSNRWSSFFGSPSTKSGFINDSRVTIYLLHKQLGIVGFYRGLLPAVVGSSASWAFYWLIYENMKMTVSLMLSLVFS